MRIHILMLGFKGLTNLQALSRSCTWDYSGTLPCGHLGYTVTSWPLFLPSGKNDHSFFCKETLINIVLSLLWPNCFGPLVWGFHCTKNKSSQQIGQWALAHWLVMGFHCTKNKSSQQIGQGLNVGPSSGLQSPQLLGHANLNKNALCHFLYRCAESFHITGDWGNDFCSLWRTAINCLAHHSPTGTVYKRYMHEPLIFSKQTLPIQRQIINHVQLLITVGL